MLSTLSRALLSRALPQSCCSLPSAASRSLHTSLFPLLPDVVVPPLGESISEGSVAEIVAQPGQQVQIDQVIAQLETDKVTIDCKTPHAGTLEQIKIKVGDVVQPGTVIAVVGGSAPSAAAPSQPSASTPPPPSSSAAPSPPQQPQPSQKPAPSPPAAGPEPIDSHARKPMISFPPRVTPDGRRISDLPAAEADKVLQQHQGQQGPGEPSPAADQAAPSAVPPGEAPHLKPALAFAPLVPEDGPKQPSAGLRVSEATQYLDTVPSRKGPSRSEMEAINTGGAD